MEQIYSMKKHNSTILHRRNTTYSEATIMLMVPHLPFLQEAQSQITSRLGMLGNCPHYPALWKKMYNSMLCSVLHTTTSPLLHKLKPSRNRGNPAACNHVDILRTGVEHGLCCTGTPLLTLWAFQIKTRGRNDQLTIEIRTSHCMTPRLL